MQEILITGAGSGFGEGTALGLAQKGTQRNSSCSDLATSDSYAGKGSLARPQNTAESRSSTCSTLMMWHTRSN